MIKQKFELIVATKEGVTSNEVEDAIFYYLEILGRAFLSDIVIARMVEMEKDE